MREKNQYGADRFLVQTHHGWLEPLLSVCSVHPVFSHSAETQRLSEL